MLHVWVNHTALLLTLAAIDGRWPVENSGGAVVFFHQCQCKVEKYLRSAKSHLSLIIGFVVIGLFSQEETCEIENKIM